MEEFKPIENKIEELYEEFLQIEGEYNKIKEFLDKVNSILSYIRKREEWIKKLLDLLYNFEKKIETTNYTAKGEELKKLASKVYGMRRRIEREFLYDPDSLIEKLRYDGSKISQNANLAEAINGIGFKLLEKVRLGQREEVLYLLLRTFKAHEEKLPESIIEAMKTKYDDALFKSFIYTFLVQILGKERKEGGKIEGQEENQVEE